MLKRKILIAMLLITVSTIANAKLRPGCAFPRIKENMGLFSIYYVAEIGTKLMMQVDKLGNLRQQEHEVEEIPLMHWKQRDRELEKRYQLDYVCSGGQQEGILYFQGITSDNHLRLYAEKVEAREILFNEIGYTTVMDIGPYTSNLVFYNNKLYLAAWIFSKWKEDGTSLYNLIICEWDISENNTRIYSVIRDLQVFHTTLSLAQSEGTLGLVYHAKDEETAYNRIRLILIDSKNMTIKKNFWVSKPPRG